MAGLKQRPGDQPLPIVNNEPDIQTQVIADIEHRREVGIQRYGTALQPFNGRDALRDLYEELLDGAMYAKQSMVERDKSTGQEQAEWDLAMTYLVSDSALTCPRTDCGEDILTDDLPPYEFGTLWDALWRHEAEHDGLEATRCTVVDVPGVGSARVQGDLDEQGAAHLAEVVKAAQRKHVEDLKAQGRDELRDTLLALRAQWAGRRAEREAHRETADGPTARLASIEHDIYARVIGELDEVLSALGVAR
ncbi:hypothetical protein GCM10009530_63370 [Microbispora corallina]|uniref:Uncharacterized protein n=1 Tax=Microbispora corallina TaxID=83302 RepID=A0ABQ4GBS2_9ACTN|nr:hypothetical protein [Microbispora corallina]GIH44433.1 hypothetical protein Mco01_74330 [Microbispora corallina]